MPADAKALGASLKRGAEDAAIKTAIDALHHLCEQLGRTVVVIEVPAKTVRVMSQETMARLNEALGDRYTIVDRGKRHKIVEVDDDA